jgi:hypothetical protein
MASMEELKRIEAEQWAEVKNAKEKHAEISRAWSATCKEIAERERQEEIERLVEERLKLRAEADDALGAGEAERFRQRNDLK